METIVRTDQEIERVINWTMEADQNGSHYSGMTYEQGVRAMYDWLIGDEDEPPDQP